MIQGDEVLAEAMFPVELWDLEATKETEGAWWGGRLKAEVPRYKAVVRTDTDTPLSVVSDRYRLIPNSDIIMAVNSSLLGHTAEIKRCELSRWGRKFMGEIHLPDHQVDDPDGNPILYRILFGGSYDGTVAAWVMSGAFRVICSNGMMIGDVDYSIRQAHIGDVGLASIRDEIRDAVSERLGVAALEKMRSELLFFEGSIGPDQLDHLIKEELPDQLPKRYIGAFMERAGIDYEVQDETGILVPDVASVVNVTNEKSRWLLYNDLTAAINHDGQSNTSMERQTELLSAAREAFTV